MTARWIDRITYLGLMMAGVYAGWHVALWMSR